MAIPEKRSPCARDASLTWSKERICSGEGGNGLPRPTGETDGKREKENREKGIK